MKEVLIKLKHQTLVFYNLCKYRFFKKNMIEYILESLNDKYRL